MAARTRVARKKSKTSNNLPEDVVEMIFSFLPYKKVCSLSILSKRFVNSWKLCRNLRFDSDFARRLSRDECRSIVDNYFLKRTTPCADTLELHYDATGENNLVSCWVRQAIQLGVKELELDLTRTTDTPMLDYELIDAERLKTIKLVKCELHLPLNSNGLRHVSELTLQNVVAGQMLTAAIFANCSSLRVLRLVKCTQVEVLRAFAQYVRGFHTLVVKHCTEMHAIEINSPTLRAFHFHGKFVDLRFYSDMPDLSDVVLDIAHPRGFQQLSHRNELLARLASVQVLTVTSIFLEGLCARFEDTGFRKMEFSLTQLEEFHLLVAPESFLNPSDVAIFVYKCPNIEKLFIDLGRNALGSSLYWDNYGKHYLCTNQETFPFLKYVKIKGFTMKELPMCMARFFLKNAISLECLILVKARVHNFPLNYSPENIRWGIISQAGIGICNYRADKKTVMPQHLRGV